MIYLFLSILLAKERQLVQGWSSVIPVFSPVSFLSLYAELPLMVLMYFCWMYFNRSRRSPEESAAEPTSSTPLIEPRTDGPRSGWFDLVDVATVDLKIDEYGEDEDEDEDERGDRTLSWLWRKIVYWLA
jgi:amino acid transporter, AAT family